MPRWLRPESFGVPTWKLDEVLHCAAAAISPRPVGANRLGGGVSGVTRSGSHVQDCFNSKPFPVLRDKPGSDESNIWRMRQPRTLQWFQGKCWKYYNFHNTNAYCRFKTGLVAFQLQILLYLSYKNSTYLPHAQPINANAGLIISRLTVCH